MNREEMQRLVDSYCKLGLIEGGGKYWHDFDEREYFVPLTMYSDYYGSCVQKANCIYLLDKFDFLTERHLSYSGSCVCFSVDDLAWAASHNSEYVEEFFSDLDDLENYPSLDDKLLSELEMEVQQESWNSFYRSDFIAELEDIFGLTDDDMDTLNSNHDEVDNVFMEVCDRAGIYWEMEGPNSAFIDIRRVAEEVLDEEVEELIVRKF